MQFAFTAAQRADQAEFASLSDGVITPSAAAWDAQQALPDALISALAGQRCLVATLPAEFGGRDLDAISFGLLCQELGRGCGSVRNLVAVQGMVAHAILRWGTAAQIDRWVSRIGTGDVLASFALSEPGSGSDARSVTTEATPVDGGYRIDGEKAWLSFAARAGVFLVFARLGGEIAALLVERDTPGLTVVPVRDLLGLRASQLAGLRFDGCFVAADNLLLRGRLTFDAVATTALDYGRYSTAWGCVGLSQGCLDASMEYARTRLQFGVPIGEHQLIRRLLSGMVASVDAARLLCSVAGAHRAEREPDAVRRTLIAKYFAASSALQVASDAVQIHGARGCTGDSAMQRYLRDAKIQEIIEGTNQIHELQIADLSMRRRPVP